MKCTLNNAGRVYPGVSDFGGHRLFRVYAHRDKKDLTFFTIYPFEDPPPLQGVGGGKPCQVYFYLFGGVAVCQFADQSSNPRLLRKLYKYGKISLRRAEVSQNF